MLPFVRIKICGLRTPEHALAALTAGADLLGIILAPSRRQVASEDAARITAAVRAADPQRRAPVVGVFVNAPVALMRELVEQGAIDRVQLSGDEPVELADELAGIPIIKTLRLNGAAHEQDWIDRAIASDVRLHVDAHVPGSYGGAGVTGDWNRAAELAASHPILLAGGLTPENVGAAIRRVHPWGVDVSSGVETDGVKDVARIQAFIAAARTNE
jgi:phosphoribosylanthranilate isomerase